MDLFSTWLNLVKTFFYIIYQTSAFFIGNTSLLLVRFTKLLFQRFLFSSLILKRCLHYFFRASISTIFVSFFSYVPLCGFHFFSSISRVDFIILLWFFVNSKKIFLTDYLSILSCIYLFVVHFVKNTLFLETPVNKAKIKIESLDKIDKKKWRFKRFASKCQTRMYLFATCNVNIWHEIQISMWILASFIVINIPLLVALKLAILLDQCKYIGIQECMKRKLKEYYIY